MIRKLILPALALIVSAPAFSQTVVRWNADEAFADKGLLTAYNPLEGMTWDAGEGVAVSFSRGASDFAPQNLFVPEPNVWLCCGALVGIVSESADIASVRAVTLADYPFLPDEARVSAIFTEAAVSGTEAVWTFDAGVHEVTLSQPGPYASIYEPGARVGLTELEITLRAATPAEEEEDGITEAITPTPSAQLYDLSGRPVATPARAHRGVYLERRGQTTRKLLR